MNDIFSLPFLNSEIIAQRFIYFSDQLLFGKLIVYPLFQMKLSVSVQRATAKAFRLSRPTRPASWKYSSNDPGISRWTTNRTFGLSIPIPKAFVATITRHSLFSNGAAGSPFLPGSVRHERNRQIFRLVAGRELPLLSVSGSGYRR